MTGLARFVVKDGTKCAGGKNLLETEIADIVLQEGCGAEVWCGVPECLTGNVKNRGGTAGESVAVAVVAHQQELVCSGGSVGDGWAVNRLFGGGCECLVTARGSGEKHNGQECSGHEHPPGMGTAGQRRQL